MRILYIPNDCSSTGDVPFLVWGGVQATTGKVAPQKQFPKAHHNLFVDFLGF